MIRNPKLEKRRKEISNSIKNEIDLSYSTAEYIDALLSKKGWTQRDLANKLGKSESEISKWMSGLHNFTFSTIGKLHEIFGEPIIVCAKDIPKEYILLIFNPSATTVFATSSSDASNTLASIDEDQFTYFSKMENNGDSISLDCYPLN